ncbi:hypothetical protein [Oricola cellulosilytica]|uniref:Uncharacterized protein n=1 Tax=Oricola cellulosilytica TaxID=1429082 RepID=A0A4R0PEM9_9HYPH|nr:hypothetical protein [Oricola cellulosilytica]TCD15088.1 hypothetical protein E0D97_05945 [Oricola cellulosilytica]
MISGSTSAMGHHLTPEQVARSPVLTRQEKLEQLYELRDKAVARQSAFAREMPEATQNKPDGLRMIDELIQDVKAP